MNKVVLQIKKEKKKVQTVEEFEFDHLLKEFEDDMSVVSLIESKLKFERRIKK